MGLKEFAIPLALLLIAVLTYLLIVGRLSQWGFVGGFLGVSLLIVVLVVIVPRYGEVAEVGAKAQGFEFLVKMREIQEEVYAKAESVRRMAEVVAEMAVFSMVRVGRFGAEDIDASLLTARDRLLEMLTTLGSTAARIHEITSPVTEIVIFDLANEVWAAAQDSVRRGRPDLERTLPEVGGKLIRILRTSKVGEATAAGRQYLEELKAWTPEVEARVAKFDEFRRTGRLPQRSSGGPQ
jgi:hypothetical protein